MLLPYLVKQLLWLILSWREGGSYPPRVESDVSVQDPLRNSRKPNSIIILLFIQNIPNFFFFFPSSKTLFLKKNCQFLDTVSGYRQMLFIVSMTLYSHLPNLVNNVS